MKKYHKLYKENSGTNCILIFENRYENNHYSALMPDGSAMRESRVNIHDLRANYKPISERKARNISPALFEYLEKAS